MLSLSQAPCQVAGRPHKYLCVNYLCTHGLMLRVPRSLIFVTTPEQPPSQKRHTGPARRRRVGPRQGPAQDHSGTETRTPWRKKLTLPNPSSRRKGITSS